MSFPWADFDTHITTTMNFVNNLDSCHDGGEMLPLIPDHGVQLKVLRGFTQFDCHRGPERNSWGKQKYREKAEAAQNVCLTVIRVKV